MLRIRSLCLTRLAQKGHFRPVHDLDYQEELDAEQMHQKLGKPINEDEEKELEASEQDENYGKTHFSMLSHTQLYQSMVTVANIDRNQLLVSSKSSGVYTLKGDAFLTKDLVLSWRGIPDDIKDLELKHFTAALLLYPSINLIILGTGNSMILPSQKLISDLKERGIALETTASLQACSTYNLLCTERDGEGVALFVKEISAERSVFMDTGIRQDTVDETMTRLRQRIARGQKQYKNFQPK